MLPSSIKKRILNDFFLLLVVRSQWTQRRIIIALQHIWRRQKSSNTSAYFYIIIFFTVNASATRFMSEKEFTPSTRCSSRHRISSEWSTKHNLWFENTKTLIEFRRYHLTMIQLTLWKFRYPNYFCWFWFTSPLYVFGYYWSLIFNFEPILQLNQIVCLWEIRKLNESNLSTIHILSRSDARVTILSSFWCKKMKKKSFGIWLFMLPFLSARARSIDFKAEKLKFHMNSHKIPLIIILFAPKSSSTSNTRAIMNVSDLYSTK